MFLFSEFAMMEPFALELFTSINWMLCCVCQNVTSDELRCPADTLRKDKGAGYKTLAEGVASCKIGAYEFPVGIELHPFLLETENLEELFMQNMAKYHYTCQSRFRISRLKRLASETNPVYRASPVKTRRLTGHTCYNYDSEFVNQDKCLFYNKDCSQATLHKVESHNVHANVLKWAKNINDFHMIGILEGEVGDMFAHDKFYHKKCITQYYNKNRAAVAQKRSEGKLSQNEL